jgi:methionyl-tRNA formyltransferase
MVFSGILAIIKYKKADNIMRIIFMGSPEFSCPILMALLKDNAHQIVAIYTQPPRPSGRKMQSTPTAIHALGDRYGIPTFTPQSLKGDAEYKKLSLFNADIFIVVAYGLLLPKNILNIPPYGAINIHASLLPRWRGAAPIQRAIEYGDKVTGITYMQMQETLDTGDILQQLQIPIDEQDTAASLHDKLSKLGEDSIIDFLKSLKNGEIKAHKQNEECASYAAKLNKQEAMIDWHDRADIIVMRHRAFQPWPGMYFDHRDEKIKIGGMKIIPPFAGKNAKIGTISDDFKVVCGDNTALQIEKLQRPGKKMLSLDEFMKGYKND